MGRGLSDLQKNILGIAADVNAHTRGGEPEVKAGQPVWGYREPTCDYRGPVDYVTPLGVLLNYDVELATRTTWINKRGHAVTQDLNEDMFFASSPSVKAAKAAASRAVSRLLERRLLLYRPGWIKNIFAGGNGYLLSAEGLAIGRGYARGIPGDRELLKVLRITATTRRAWALPGVEYIDSQEMAALRRSLMRQWGNGYHASTAFAR